MTDNRKKEIEKIASKFRNNCTMDESGIIDLFKDCQKLGYYVIRYPLNNTYSLGFTIRRYDDIIIYTNSGIELMQEIFTIAHEIGHIQLHTDSDYCFLENIKSISGNNTEENEAEANYFASCLLTPEKETKNIYKNSKLSIADNDILIPSEYLDYVIYNYNHKAIPKETLDRALEYYGITFDDVSGKIYIGTGQRPCPT